jgi:UDP-N-acetylmuramate dehydrogenase
MQNNKYDEYIKELSGKIDCKIVQNEELKNHSYFKIGGNADLFAEPSRYEELREIIQAANKYDIEFYVIGNGTNLLVSDKGYRGLIIKIGEKFSDIMINDNIIIAGAGALLSKVAKDTAANGLCGLEFACGIPGFVGGGVAMNAGAYNGEIKEAIHCVSCMNKHGEIYNYTIEEMNFGYRDSKVLTDDLIVLSVQFNLEYGDKEKILARVKLLNEKRTASQPLSYPSAGSTFKRPENGFAAKLIEDAGLKGFKHGGAMVSDLHSGFVINYNKASCQDVMEIMEIIIKTVQKKFNIILEPEVKIIGEF